MALLTKDAQQKVVQLLINEGLIDRSVVGAVQEEVGQTKQSLLATLIRKKALDEETAAHATAVMMRVPYIDLKNVEMDQEILQSLPRDVAERTMAIPVGEQNGQLIVAMLDVSNVQAMDYLSSVTQRSIHGVMASEKGIRAVLAQYRGDFSSVKEVAQEAEEEKRMQLGASVKTITQDSPISKALTTILDFSAKSKASDIHIEPLENALVIRCRIDGVLRQIMDLPKSVEPALVSRIKILANLKIDEHRIPQDGQFTVLVGGKEIDLRIATSPVVWGEQVVIRLLDKTGTAMEVEKMGMTGRALRMVTEGISKPNGMILTSGPTGSGKSTTLYALITKIK